MDMIVTLVYVLQLNLDRREGSRQSLRLTLVDVASLGISVQRASYFLPPAICGRLTTCCGTSFLSFNWLAIHEFFYSL